MSSVNSVIYVHICDFGVIKLNYLDKFTVDSGKMAMIFSTVLNTQEQLETFNKLTLKFIKKQKST